MATTTNYSWTTPDDTALVKNGAAAIRSLGTAIDSTVFTNAGNAIAKTIVDAKGDIIAATAADTVARLAVGTNDQVLIADSSTATGLKWGSPAAGGMTLISTTTLSGVTTTLSSIPQTYEYLFLEIDGVTGNTNDNAISILPNNVNNLTNFTRVRSASTPNVTGTNDTKMPVDGATSIDRTSADNSFAVTIYNYNSTTRFKPFQTNAFFLGGGGGSTPFTLFAFGAFRSNTAITSLVFEYGGSDTFAGGTVRLYGVK